MFSTVLPKCDKKMEALETDEIFSFSRSSSCILRIFLLQYSWSSSIRMGKIWNHSVRLAGVSKTTFMLSTNAWMFLFEILNWNSLKRKHMAIQIKVLTLNVNNIWML